MLLTTREKWVCNGSIEVGNDVLLRERGKQDYNQARQWYQIAAEQGDMEAQDNLGVMYANGLGVKQYYEV